MTATRVVQATVRKDPEYELRVAVRKVSNSIASPWIMIGEKGKFNRAASRGIDPTVIIEGYEVTLFDAGCPAVEAGVQYYERILYRD